MSVTSVKEIHEGREGGDQLSGGKSQSDRVRAFRVITDNVYDGAEHVLANCGVSVGEVHPTNSTLYVSRRRAVNDRKSKNVWIVTITYGDETSEGGKSPQPTDDRVKISWATDATTEPVRYDKDNQPILNSAGQFLDDLKAENARWKISIKKNLYFVPTWILSYRNAINSDSFVIDGILVPQYAAKISSLAIGEWEQRNGYAYRALELGIAIRETWVRSLVDVGLIRKQPDDSTKRIRCSTNDGVFMPKPVLLDGSGNQLEDPTPDKAVYFDAHIYPELPFSYLPIFY